MHESQEIIDDAREFVHREAEAVEVVVDQIGPEFVEFAKEVLAVKGKVIVTGVGTSGTVAHRFAHLLSVTGTPAFYLSPVDGLHGSLGVVTEDDLVIAISKGGESSELNEMLKRSKDRGAATAALTSAAEGSLARVADHSVVIVSPDADLGGVVAMGSTLAHEAWGDALCMTLMRLSGYGWGKVLHSHPGGAVGLKSLDDIVEG